jgi:hypothetical protein
LPEDVGNHGEDEAYHQWNDADLLPENSAKAIWKILIYPGWIGGGFSMRKPRLSEEVNAKKGASRSPALRERRA